MNWNCRRRTTLREFLRLSVMLMGLSGGLVGLCSSRVAAQLDVCIDPGHGGTDSGAPGFNGDALPNEKELNIAVAGWLQNELLALGYESYRTQNTDTTFYDHMTRVMIAHGEIPNDEGLTASCRVFISIHMNGNASAAALGTETFYATDKYDAKTRLVSVDDSSLAAKVHSALMTYAPVVFFGCSKDRGRKVCNGFTVIARTQVPAVLVECCFISNGCQWSHMITAGGQDLVARGIAVGVGNYFMSGLAPSAPHSMGKRIARVTQGATRSEAGSLYEDFEGSAFPPEG
jgi:N-acetylmuramoyl-L-alanine amidase